MTKKYVCRDYAEIVKGLSCALKKEGLKEGLDGNSYSLIVFETGLTKHWLLKMSLGGIADGGYKKVSLLRLWLVSNGYFD